MFLPVLVAAVALLPEGGTNVVVAAWEEGGPFTDVVVRPPVRDFTPYDRCVLDYVFQGESGDTMGFSVATAREVLGKDDVLAATRTLWRETGVVRWSLDLSDWPEKADPTDVALVRLRLDYSHGGLLMVKGLTLLEPGEELPRPAMTDAEIATCERLAQEAEARHRREFEEPRAAFVEKCAAAGLDTSRCAFGIADSMSRVRPREGFDAAAVRPAVSASLRLARGEHEALQAVVMPVGAGLRDVRATCEGASDGLTVTCAPMGYVRTRQQPEYPVGFERDGRRCLKSAGIGWWPDPILSYTNACDVAADDVQSFWIDVKASADAAAGEHRLTVRLSGVGEFPLTVKVDRFTLPATSPLPLLVTFNPRPNAARCSAAEIARQQADPKAPCNVWQRQRDAWADFLADHFVMMDNLYSRETPYLDQLQRMKAQGRLGAFTLGYWNPAFGDGGTWRARDLAELREAHARVAAAGLLDRAWLYGADEVPAANLAAVDSAARMLHEELPGVPVLTTAMDYTYGVRAPHVDAFCPLSEFYVAHADAMPLARAKGKGVWWYVCNNPIAPWANLFLESSPAEARLLMGAMASRERPDGFLYYEIAYWSSPEPISGGPFTDWEPGTGRRVDGDGSLVCCGPDGLPLSTQRFENFRDGVEDLACVKLAEARYGRRTDVPAELMRSMTDFTDDPAKVRAWRDCLADAVLGSSAAALSTEAVVQDTPVVTLFGPRNAISMTALKVDDLPAELEPPIFRFDASRTEGWELGADGRVIRVPSLAGDGRYLTSDVTEPGTSWSTWNAADAGQTMKPPRLVTGVSELGGGNAIDFGAQGSGCGLLFNAVAGADGVVRNALENIGTVVAVYDSTDGGGYLLGGGTKKGSSMDWGRGNNSLLATASAVDYHNLLVAHAESAKDARGMYWQDDLYGAAANGGLGGCWQVIAYSPQQVLPSATGLGIGCTQKWYRSYSGGMKIAELLVFDRVLSADDLRRLGIWLQKKWFDRSPAGYNGRAAAATVRVYRPSSGEKQAVANAAAVDVRVGDGETLEIGSFVGGRAGAAGKPADLRKTGDGTLRVRDIRSYNGTVTLAGGTFALEPKRTVPTAETLPKGLLVRIDPSDDASRVDTDEAGGTCVAAIGSLSPMTRLGERIWARALHPGTSGETPALLRNALGAGLHVLDFGPAASFADGGRQYLFATNGTQGAAVSLPSVCTVVAVVGAQQGGGHVLDGMMFKRGYQWIRPNDGAHTYPLLNPADVWSGDSPEKESPQKYGALYVDGVKRAPDAGYPTPTYHVLAMQVPQCTVYGVARWSDGWGGGLKLGELLLFNRPLSEAELMDAQAYLAKKWLGRTLPGYREETTVADVQNVVVAEPSAVDVPAGDTVRIANLTARTHLVKTGEGALVVGPGSDTSGVVVREGTMKKETNPPDVSSACELAAGESLRLDANSAGRFDLMLGHEGENRITCWNDERFRNCAYQFALTQNENVLKHPTLTTAPELGGRPVVDFGPYSDVTDHGCSGHLLLEKPLDSVRSVYLVIGLDAAAGRNGGNPLGTVYRENDLMSSWGLGDFARARIKAVSAETPWFSAANENVRAGELYVNGVRAAFDAAVPQDGYQLVELHTAAGASFSELGRNLFYYDEGGFRLGELVVYERELTEREKVATRNYLLKKWFGRTDGELAPLPEKPAVDPTTVRRAIVVDEDQALDVSDPIHARRLTGGATLVKTGGTLSVDDLSDFEGTLAVVEGTVKLSGLPLAVTPKLKEAGRILHLDATRNVTVSTNEDRTVSVSEWASVLNDGWTAVPGVSYGDKKMHLPALLQNELNDLPVVKMTYHGWTSGEEYMLFEKDGERDMLKNIRSVFWVIGSQEGGGFLLGGGLKNNTGKSTAAWCRKGQSGGTRGQRADDGLIDSSFAHDDLYAWSDWRLNGGEIFTQPGLVGLSGGYDVLSMVEWTTTDPKHRSWNPASADGLAFDGRILNGEDWRQHCGNQRLAELVIYDTFVTGDDRLATEAYLSSKWGLSQRCPTNAATVALAAGTTLVSEKGSQYVGKLVGEGAVEGDVSVGAFVADAAATSLLSIDGTLTIPPAVSFDVRNLVFGVEPVTIPVCTATACEGVENLRKATITGLSDDCRGRAKFVDGMLVVVVKGRGMPVIIR